MKKDDPYAGLGVYEQVDVDPYADLGVVEIATPRAKAPRTGMDKATQVAGVTSGALLPYATAAGLGALATGVPTGGLGAPFGAGAGMLALGVGDIGTSLYNLGGSLFNADRIPLPSETISKMYRNVGVGRSPETRGEQVYSDILKAAVAGGGQAKGFQLAESAATSPQTRNFMNMMGQNIRGQVGASMGAAGAPSVASNYFDVTNPYALMGLSLAGGGMGAKVATPTPKPVTAAALKEESGKLYRAMEAENVNIAPQAMTDLGAAARTKLSTLRYDPDTDKVVNEALKLFDLKSGKPMTFDMLEKFRRSVRDLPYSEAGGKRGTPDERAMVKALEEVIDDFMDGLTPAQTTSGNAAAANAFLTQARGVRGRGYQTETLENAFTAATRTSSTADSTKSFPRALRDEFAKIAKNERKLSRFDKPTQELIKKVANGTVTQKILMTLGNLSPSARLFGTQMPLYGAGYGGLATLSPTTAAVVGGTQTAAAIAKGAANRMTRTQANRALVSAAQPGGGIKPGGQGFFALSPVAQQNVLAQDRAKQAAERRRLGF
jgi:hypothetical protein